MKKIELKWLMIYVNEINDNLGSHIEVNTGGLCNSNLVRLSQ